METMHEFFDPQVKSEIKKRLRALRLPYSAHQILKHGLDQLLAIASSRAWCLPPTKLEDEIHHYSSRYTVLGLKGPRPVLRSSLEKNLAEELALKIDASIKFFELAIDADLLVRPILLYYSCAHICGVYTRAFFDWQNDSRKHGLQCNHASGNVAKTKVTIGKRGQFPRLATTCFLLSGMPSCFSDLVTYSSPPTSHTGPGELLEKFGKAEVGSPITELTLDELITFDYGKRLKIVREQHGFHKFKGLPTTAFLIDVITLFVGSSLARYDVIGWREILEGKNNSYRIHFEETFERFQNSMINYLLAMLENPSFSFDQAFLPTQPSPYSHNDRTRFKDDPNYVS
jgi:hypothetical protein